MNKNALMFNLHVENKNSMHYYSMLYYALETLEKVYDGTFDVVVHYKIKNFEFEKEFHLDKFNIYRQFLFPIYIESAYSDQDGYMAKWYALQKTFELGYEKVFMIDVDVIFCGNFSYMFEKYGNKNVAHIGSDGWDLDRGGYRPILGRKGISSESEIILRKAVQPLDTFFERALEHRRKLIQKSEEMMKNGQVTEKVHNMFKFFSEQYAGNFAVQDPYDPDNIPEEKKFVSMQHEDLVETDESNYLHPDRFNETNNPPYYCLNIKDNITRITNIRTKIIHYSTYQAPIYVPKRLFTDVLRDGLQREIIIEWTDRIKKLNGRNYKSQEGITSGKMVDSTGKIIKE
jgi:hypothetical protein|tara:strand:+ start:45 stop:1076 length:1032 start_codon:yes stop_codon:yes gene_type:complete